MVEVLDHGLVEGVWNGEFMQGRFDRASTFFGSGFVWDEDGVTFVPSRATVDRLFSLETSVGWLVSNSLSLIAFAEDLQTLDSHKYIEESWSIAAGVDKYKQSIPMNSRDGKVEVRQHLYSPFSISFEGIVSQQTEWLSPPFEAYDDYHAFLQDVLHRLVLNARSGRRRFRGGHCARGGFGDPYRVHQPEVQLPSTSLA